MKEPLGGAQEDPAATGSNIRKMLREALKELSKAKPDKLVADRYAKAFHPSFLGLSGSPEAVREAAQTFGVFYQKSQYRGPGEYLVDHTATTFVVKEGRLVLLYSPDKAEATDRVVADLQALL